MASEKTITVSRNHAILGLIAVLILLIGFFLYVFRLPPVADFPPGLVKVNEQEKVDLIILAKEDGKIDVLTLGPDRSPIRLAPCGAVKNGVIPVECDLKNITMKVLRTINLTIFDTERNPDCRYVYDENGEIIRSYHKYRTSWQPCHQAHGPDGPP